VFSTYLYTGTGATQTITNGIDLSTKGGLVWTKNRTYAGTSNTLYDTLRGVNKGLESNTTGAQVTGTNELTAFNTNGFTVGSSSTTNWNTYPYASWTFRKQPKFFDVVTFTGNGAAGQTINHNLGSVPGFMVVKRTNTTGDWASYHRSLGATQIIFLNDTQAAGATVQAWNNTEPTSTQFTVGVGYNASGSTYVAYLFAHNAGGFGLTGTDNVISCGSYTGTGAAGNAITLGYEPQWLMVKNASTANQNWEMFDNMRGLPTGGNSSELFPNTSDAERTAFKIFNVTATGFVTGTSALDETNASGDNYIYIAIRRGPMKVPTSGTSVFSPVARTGTGATANVTGVGFAPDFLISKNRTSSFQGLVVDKLRGSSRRIMPDATNAEDSQPDAVTAFLMDGISVGTDGTGAINYAGGGDTYITYFFRRAPSFFDEVCYTGANSTAPQSHNLGVVPELMIVKKRSSATSALWAVYSAALGNTKVIVLNSSASAYDDTLWNNTTPTATGFTLGANLSEVNLAGQTYVAYLFATTAGVSKVGSYTGNGSSQTINCGFTGGARFVLIKKSSGTGDWMVSDSARGIVSGNDPYLELNNANAEVTGEDWLDTDSTGFIVNEVSGSNANTNGATYIFLAIA
jgi:hypothetical protein